MEQNIDLKELERKAWTSYFEDGFLDIIIGLILLVSILSSTLSEMGVSDLIRITIYLPLMFLCPVIYVLGKRYVTIPRLGFVKFGPERKAKRTKVIITLIISQLVLLIILFITIVKPFEVGFLLSIMVTLNILVAFLLIAYFFDYSRMYIIGVLVAFSEPTYYYLEHHTNITHIGLIAYGIPAIIILVMGAVALWQFLQKYPLPTEGTANGN